MLHPRSWFPIVVVVLSVGLALFVASVVRDRVPVTTGASGPAAVDDAAYRASVKATLVRFESAYAAADADLSRLAVVEKALDAVLALKVPAEERDLHLTVAVALNHMQNGLRGEDGALAKGRAALDAAYERSPWLK
ncbi:hypothetical protein A2856_03625 [Candidatus Uhrbacteria bacterium RIFCSPHIGHO2_01_FULL_63_20]|uniref:DUF5667 domain-containing protein n=1 Tax=Candidatus Uhrbacteria bacterium RIFCSPHIGHO2_01_FULL_63_20 TaxID=1802385 RepID=A0A1F7TMC4_9BACT|nr:MAG: hypothetical protein A2856_03625 [Candidatus Uhrbacteria bacterium RIFCSPHIGHO2_01_FULL_63_20]